MSLRVRLLAYGSWGFCAGLIEQILPVGNSLVKQISGFTIWSLESLEAGTIGCIQSLNLEPSISEDRIVTWGLQMQAEAVLYFIVLGYISHSAARHMPKNCPV